MRHPFILQFLGVCEHGPDIFIVTEYLSAGRRHGAARVAEGRAVDAAAVDRHAALPGE
jgi:hypothetical protein